MIVAVVILLALGVKYIPHLQKIAYPYPHRIIIEKYANEYGVDPFLAIAVIREESKFLPRSESNKGAKGLMQLMPETAKEVAELLGEEFNEDDLYEPEKNIQYGIKYIAILQKEFDHPILILASYNGGQGHVREWIKAGQLNLDNLSYDGIPFRETRNYVERVLKSYLKYQTLYGV